MQFYTEQHKHYCGIDLLSARWLTLYKCWCRVRDGPILSVSLVMVAPQGVRIWEAKLLAHC